MRSFCFGVLFSLFGLLSHATAQCATQWLPPIGPSGPNNAIHALATLPNGDVIAGGVFTQIGGVPANNVARWDGVAWNAMGTGTDAQVTEVRVLQNGDLLVGGHFTTAGGVPAAGIARWNGTVWSSLGTPWPPMAPPAQSAVNAILERADGTIVAAGWVGFGYTLMRAAAWDGTTWTALPFPPFPFGYVNALAEGPNGDVLLGAPGAGILQWDGATMQPLVTGAFVYDLVTLSSGHVIAAGEFTDIGGVPANRVARWDGSSWSAIGTGTDNSILCLQVLPDGDLVVGGRFTQAGGGSANQIARWDGASWSTFGAGLAGMSGVALSTVIALAMPPAGPLFVGGTFATADGNACPNLARLGTTCPALSQTFGYGCGTNTLAITDLPWANGTFRATGTGLATTAVVLTITSVTPLMPGLGMNAVYRIGIPGCDLFVTPDILGVVVTTNGTAVSEFFLPDTPPIVGLTFYHQMIPWEIGPAGITAITATNALQLTVGQF